MTHGSPLIPVAPSCRPWHCHSTQRVRSTQGQRSAASSGVRCWCNGSSSALWARPSVCCWDLGRVADKHCARHHVPAVSPFAQTLPASNRGDADALQDAPEPDWSSTYSLPHCQRDTFARPWSQSSCWSWDGSVASRPWLIAAHVEAARARAQEHKHGAREACGCKPGSDVLFAWLSHTLHRRRLCSQGTGRHQRTVPVIRLTDQ